MKVFTTDLETFQAERRNSQDEAIDLLSDVVRDSLAQFGEPGWQDPIVQAATLVWDATQEADGGDVPVPEEFTAALSEALDQTAPPSDPPSDEQVARVATWVAVYTINASTEALAEASQAEEGDLVLREWVTMQDADVRDLHRPLHGVQRPVGETFNVGGAQLRWPGDPVGPAEGWINCRCVLRLTLGDEMAAKTVTAASDVLPEEEVDADPTFPVEEELTDEDIFGLMMQADLNPSGVPIHGVLIDTSEETGDGRHLAGEFPVLSVVDGPVPLRWVKSDVGLHDNAVRVASITDWWREGDRILYNGNLIMNTEADEVIGLLAEGRVGLSVDLDSAVFDIVGEGEEETKVFREGRIRSATLVDIPALTGAWAELGSWEDIDTLAASGCAPCEEQQALYRQKQAEQFQISEADWDGSSARFTDEQWCASAIVHLEEGCTSKANHKLPIREPGGALNRNAVHNAAARFNQVEAPESALAAARRSLRAAYNELGEEPPEVITAAAFQTGIPAITQDAPGWITHPTDTSRLRRYWTEGAGAAKIAWGTPGDWARCKVQLVKYVQRPDWLSGLCANMHFDALGYWPGQHVASSLSVRAGSLLASAGPTLVRSGVESFGIGDIVAVSADGSRIQAPAEVLSPGDRLQVVGVDALTYSAQVVKVEPLGDAAVLSLVGEDVRAGALPPTVAVPVPGTEPQVTSGGVDRDVVIELRLSRWLDRSTGEQSPVVPFAQAATESPRGAVAVPRGGASDTGDTVLFIPHGREPIMASAFTVVDERKTLPAAWFENPNLKMPTPVTVTQEGRVFGHIATWGTCHTGLGLSVGDGNACVAAPPSNSGYAYFLTGVVDTDGGEVPVGSLTMGTGHAAERLSAHPAAAHYDNTGSVVADVTVGEDEHGIWFSGAMRPGLDDDRVREFKASTLSGDWRKVRGDYEMVAALSVNVPGFPIPRLSLAASGGRQITLIAAGVVPPRTDEAAPAITPVEFVKEVRAIEARASKARALKEQFAARRTKEIKERRLALAAALEG